MNRTMNRAINRCYTDRMPAPQKRIQIISTYTREHAKLTYTHAIRRYKHGGRLADLTRLIYMSISYLKCLLASAVPAGISSSDQARALVRGQVNESRQRVGPQRVR